MHCDLVLFLMSLPMERYEIGMIGFDDIGHTIHPNLLLNTKEDVFQLIRAIPYDTELGTCIGCALEMGIDVSNLLGNFGWGVIW